ncbi:M14 family zinc carboxypeptidase [Streptomyces paludis]|uniref:M14 family zinc carboxypeptidase n=1 Tax=Streptomyces paludis TaxID=2282738 RepID=UPI0013B42AEA|nr:M14 family zinc carboxypeptidase [Streptomyces paludis]
MCARRQFDRGLRAVVPGSYLDIDELTLRAEALVSAYPGRATLRRIGSSRAGEPIRLLSVGRGSRHVLVVAGPHANEPVGGVTVLRLARHLANADARADEKPGAKANGDASAKVNGGAGAEAYRSSAGPADTVWHFVLSLDPDGARRNERWLKGPMTMEHHFRNFFRPGFAAQPEWLPTAPGARPLPETRALLDIQDELRPYLQCSLHSADVGGGFVQLTRRLPGLSGPLLRSAGDLGIPVELGPYDAFFWPSPGPGVFDMPRPEETDQFSSLPSATATSTWFHPHRYGTVTAVVEAPMWAVDAVGDASPHPDPHGALDTIGGTLRGDARLLSGLLEQVRAGLPATAGPLLAPIDEYLGVSPGLADEWASEAVRGPAPAAGRPGRTPPMNRARVMTLRIAARRLMARSAGLMHQLLADGGDGPTGAAAHDVRTAVDRFLTERCQSFEADCRARWVPVRDQAEHQFRVVLAASELAAGAPGIADSPRTRTVRT